jgi:hypothetical protein
MMSRTIGIVAFVAMALVAMAAVDADAHWTIVSGKLVYHSIDCDSVWKNVKNLSETNPAEGICSIVGVTVETECESPTHKIVKGTASHPIVFAPVSAPVEQTDAEKQKGRGHVNVPVIEDHVTLGIDSDQVCNNNWTLRRAILREAVTTVDIYVPDVASGNKVSTAEFTCTLPANFNFNNPPAPPLEVSCELDSFTHLQ